MEQSKAIVIFQRTKKNFSVDLEIPLRITCRDLIEGLNEAYRLGIDMTDERECYMAAENPIVLLRGEDTLAECGIRNGSTILFTR